MLVEKIKVVEVTTVAMNVKAIKNSMVGLIVKSPKKARVKARTPRNESRKKIIKRCVTSDKDKRSLRKSKTTEISKVKTTTIDKAAKKKAKTSKVETNIDKSTKIILKKMNTTKKVKTASGKKQKEHIIEKILCKVRRRGQQHMLKIKWAGWKITIEEPVGSLKSDQQLMVEEFYKNKK